MENEYRIKEVNIPLIKENGTMTYFLPQAKREVEKKIGIYGFRKTITEIVWDYLVKYSDGTVHVLNKDEFRSKNLIGCTSIKAAETIIDTFKMFLETNNKVFFTKVAALIEEDSKMVKIHPIT
jgi:hypothetical protein